MCPATTEVVLRISFEAFGEQYNSLMVRKLLERTLHRVNSFSTIFENVSSLFRAKATCEKFPCEWKKKKKTTYVCGNEVARHDPSFDIPISGRYSTYSGWYNELNHFVAVTCVHSRWTFLHSRNGFGGLVDSPAICKQCYSDRKPDRKGRCVDGHLTDTRPQA